MRAAIAATSGSSAFSTAVPSTGRHSTSSPLPSATASIEPNSERCTAATSVTTPTVGRPTRHSSAMWPTPRAPISSTAHWVSSGAPINVSGRPISLLYEPMLAVVR